MNRPTKRQSLKEEICQLIGISYDNPLAEAILSAIELRLPEKKDERLNKTSGEITSPPQLIDIEAKGYNQAILDIKRLLNGDD